MPIQKKKTAVQAKQVKKNGKKKSASRAKPVASKAKVSAKKPAAKIAKLAAKKVLPKKKKGVSARKIVKKVDSAKKGKVKPKAAIKKPATKKLPVTANSKKKVAAVKKTRLTTPKAVVAKKPVVISKKAPVKIKKSATTTKKQNKLVKNTSISAPKQSHSSATSKKTQANSTGPSGFDPYTQKQGEDYMNETQLMHFHHVLNLWKKQLYLDRDATTQHMRDDSVNFADPLDRAVLEEEHTLEWRAREREHRLIAKIDQALAHIKQGDYGYCEMCGSEIGVRRLEARPTATLCIDCKTINEIRERQTGTMEQ